MLSATCLQGWIIWLHALIADSLLLLILHAIADCETWLLIIWLSACIFQSMAAPDAMHGCLLNCVVQPVVGIACYCILPGSSSLHAVRLLKCADLTKLHGLLLYMQLCIPLWVGSVGVSLLVLPLSKAAEQICICGILVLRKLLFCGVFVFMLFCACFMHPALQCAHEVVEVNTK